MSDRRVVAQAHRRLLDLHEISKLLLRFETPESTLPEVLSILGRALTSRVSILYEGRDGLQTLDAMQIEAFGTPAPGLEEAPAMAAYRYLTGVAQPAPVNDVTAASAEYSRPWSRHLATLASDDRPERFIVLPLVVKVKRAFGAVQIRGDDTLDEMDLIFASMVVRQLAIALDREATADVERREVETRHVELTRAEREQSFLSDVSAALIDFRAQESVLAAAVRLAVPFLADVCFADEVADDGALAPLKFGFADGGPDELRLALIDLAQERLNSDLPARGLRTGAFVLAPPLTNRDPPGVSEARPGLRTPEGRSVMVVRLAAHGRQFGALTLLAAPLRRAYDAQDLALAEEMSRRVAAAIHNERLACQAERVLRDRQDVLALVSHDLRAPLAALSMGAEGMLRGAPEFDRRQNRKTLEQMDRSVHRMDKMVQDLLDASSLESGVLSIRKEWHELSPIVAEALETHELAVSHKSLTLRVDVPRDTLRICCDRYRILQVLSNLLGNAIKFTPSGGSIELTAHRAESEILFSVTDTGSGVATKDLVHIFDRHWQSNRKDSGIPRGTGLGLYISKGIVEAHGGKIWAHSKLNEWCAFSFTIPNEWVPRDP